MADISNQKTSNVLSLDGGGVRGLSALLILRKLLCFVNYELNNHKPGSEQEPLPPLDVFDIVVGTSTGGLIALMIVKLKMDVDQCIEAYKNLSKEIFSHWHRASLLTLGFGRVKTYSGRLMKEVIVEQLIKPNPIAGSYRPEYFLMQDASSHEASECSVVCHELDPVTKVVIQDPVFICSHASRKLQASCCSSRIAVVDAARATSAAPTYFSPVELAGRLFVDGGFGHTNNPSFAAWDHYFFRDENAFNKIQFVNIGMGAAAKDSKPNKKWWISWIPFRPLRDAVRVFLGMGEITTDTNTVVSNMRCLAQTSHTLEYSNFSANKGGIKDIGLAEYKKLKELEDLTNEYLKDETVLSELRKLARELADTYVKRREAPKEKIEEIVEQMLQATPILVSGPDTYLRPGVISVDTETNLGLTDATSIPSPRVQTPSVIFTEQITKGDESHFLQQVGAGLLRHSLPQ